MKALKSLAGGIAALASAGMLLCAAAVSAQTFEGVHGGPTCLETGRSVVAASRGGYLSVGETYSKDATCSQGDIYVVRVRDDGTQHWASWYDFGGDETVTSVKEVLSGPASTGGFIITGTTQNNNSVCTPTTGIYDIFLLRIDYCGNVLWSRTYGRPESAEYGWDVVEAQRGDATVGTNPGDFILAGSTTFPNPNAWSPRNGYLLRVSGVTGAIIWDGYYNGPSGGDDEFYSLDESRTGDVIAAGISDSYGNGYQGWVARVNGNNGRFTGPLHAAAAYGGTNFEEFRSVRERDLSTAGDIVLTGTTRSIGNSDNVYVVQTAAYPCTLIGDLVFGNFNPNAPCGGYAIREIPFAGGFYTVGQLIITGYTWNTNGRQEDVFLQVVRPGTTAVRPALNGGMARYGGNSMDWGWSVEPAPASTGSVCRSNGFIVAGFTLSPTLIGNDQGQLYLIKTDENLRDNCTEDPVIVPGQNPGWLPSCNIPPVVDIRRDCSPPILRGCVVGWCRYCYCRLTTQSCKLDQCTQCMSTSAEICKGTVRRFCPDTPPTKSLMEESAETGSAILSALSSVPNPVKRGNDLMLNYTLATDATMAVTVSDLTGREVHSSTVSGTAGNGSIAITTKGWASGAYVVSVKVGDKATTTRVIVAE